MKHFWGFNPDINKNAYLNWRFMDNESTEKNFIKMSEGYFDSCKSLIGLCIDENKDKKADIYIFPILFTFIHALELSQKSIIMSLNNKYSLNLKTITHNIDELQKEIVEVLEKEDKDAVKEFEGINDIIEKLTKLSNRMDYPRYPTDIKGNKYDYIDSSDNIVIDLEELIKDINMCQSIMTRMADYYEYINNYNEY